MTLRIWWAEPYSGETQWWLSDTVPAYWSLQLGSEERPGTQEEQEAESTVETHQTHRGAGWSPEKLGVN